MANILQFFRHRVTSFPPEQLHPENSSSSRMNEPIGNSAAVPEFTNNITAAISSATDATSPQNQPRLRMVPQLTDNFKGLTFPIIEKTIPNGQIWKIRRFVDKPGTDFSNCITFRSKVISRQHAELWTEGDMFFIRDTKSSSGTFINNVRISPPNQDSKPVQLKDGDIIQLGVDYQGRSEDIFKCVRIRVELNREKTQQNTFYRAQVVNALKTFAAASKNSTGECCICLSKIAPLQALFIAPCCHAFHFKCVRPLLTIFPNFLCPLCRNYADLESSVSTENFEDIWTETTHDQSAQPEAFGEDDSDKNGDEKVEKGKDKMAGRDEGNEVEPSILPMSPTSVKNEHSLPTNTDPDNPALAQNFDLNAFQTHSATPVYSNSPITSPYSGRLLGTVNGNNVHTIAARTSENEQENETGHGNGNNFNSSANNSLLSSSCPDECVYTTSRTNSFNRLSVDQTTTTGSVGGNYIVAHADNDEILCPIINKNSEEFLSQLNLRSATTNTHEIQGHGEIPGTMIPLAGANTSMIPDSQIADKVAADVHA